MFFLHAEQMVTECTFDVFLDCEGQRGGLSPNESAEVR